MKFLAAAAAAFCALGTVLLSAAAAPLHPRTGGLSGWKCLTSPSNGNASVWVTALGPNYTEIACLGATHDSCIWFGDRHCTQIVSGVHGNVGRICCHEKGGWCGEAHTLLESGRDDRCPGCPVNTLTLTFTLTQTVEIPGPTTTVLLTTTETLTTSTEEPTSTTETAPASTEEPTSTPASTEEPTSTTDDTATPTPSESQ